MVIRKQSYQDLSRAVLDKDGDKDGKIIISLEFCYNYTYGKASSISFWHIFNTYIHKYFFELCA
jgi:hypothetical protein